MLVEIRILKKCVFIQVTTKVFFAPFGNQLGILLWLALD